jgi:hypothetical protein
MANACELLKAGYSTPCQIEDKSWVQKAVIINKDDIDTITYTVVDTINTKVNFELKATKKGYAVTTIEASSIIKGYATKSRGDNGYPQYLHNVDIIVSGVDNVINEFLQRIDLGLYVVALRTNTNKIIVYGIGSGLVSTDYTQDIVEGGGTYVVTLNSKESSQEGNLPLQYVSATPSNEVIDFEALFENPGT